MDWDTFIQLTLNGLTAGSTYALIALGYTLVYGVLKLLNFAHGDVFMVGSFIGFGVLKVLGGASDPVVPVWLLITLMVLALDDRMRRPRRRDRALRLPAAARRTPHRAADQRARRLVPARQLDAADVRRPAVRLRHLQPRRRLALHQGLRHRERPRPADPDHHDPLGLRADGRAVDARDAHAHRQGDARNLVRPRGRRDDGHQHRPRDRVHVRDRLGARRRGGRDVRAARARPRPRSAS